MVTTRDGGKRALRRPLLIGLLLVMLSLLAGCKSFTAQAPSGFATYEKGGAFRAVSPDGVIYRVRDEKNKPQAELAFWKEALKKRMLDAGYRFVSESDVKAGAAPGYLLELNAPQGSQDYTYLTALFVQGDRLVIVESAGEVSRFKSRRDVVLEAIGKIAF